MESARLSYRPVGPSDLDDFLALVQDDHVRRYLLDGNLVDRAWCAERIAGSQALFQARGVGLWLVRQRADHRLVGFCGFMVFPELQPEPQLLYALLQPFTGQGFATEMGRFCIQQARSQPEFQVIPSSVDAVNAASLRVVEKLGFQRLSTVQGSFGDLYLLQLPR